MGSGVKGHVIFSENSFSVCGVTWCEGGSLPLFPLARILVSHLLSSSLSSSQCHQLRVRAAAAGSIMFGVGWFHKWEGLEGTGD